MKLLPRPSRVRPRTEVVRGESEQPGRLLFQPSGDFSYDLAQAGLIRRRQAILRPNVLVVGERDHARMMRGVVVTKDPLAPLKKRVGVVDAHRVAKFGADDLVEIQERVIPEERTASNDTVVIVRGQESEWLLQVTYQRILAQSPFQRCEVIVDLHAAASSRCMNWRTGSDVKYR